MNLPAHLCGYARPAFIWALLATVVLVAAIALPAVNLP